MRLFNPVSPGDILRAYMADTITVTALAKHLGVPRQNLSMVLHGRLRISAAVALRLSEAFPQSDPEFWMNLQTQYDIAQERKKKRKQVKPLLEAA